MDRFKLSELVTWKNSSKRKPLIVQGARQVGKTWLIKTFGTTYYRQCVYVNFENETSLQDLFEKDFDIMRIIRSLQIFAQMQITADDTLIVFDEIQAAPRGLTSLKYFCENAPQYHVIAAGSLLGMGLHEGLSFPVGKVNFMDLRPLSFFEFLLAQHEELMVKALQEGEWEAIAPFHDKLMNQLKLYFYVGGMPEVVQTYLQTNDFEQVRQVQREILSAYEADFSKHAPVEIVPRIQMVWRSLPAQLAKENKKFVYGVLREGARAKDFELAIEWLCNCGLFLKSQRIAKPQLPLIAYQDLPTFKLFLSDVGLLSAMSGLNPHTLLEKERIFTEFKGALTEQYVMQTLRLHAQDYIGYWTNERSTAEVDFVIQREGTVIPIEVKAEANVRSKSFKLFCEKYQPQTAVRFSMLPYKQKGWMTNIPLYGAETLLPPYL
ncbi:MAG: ATP-binding protein [Mediterranea sp.]|jgi:predicted AAA+ superfamily ATPase|nr:ATP-binding protein [Mediterranea sp.]